MKERNFAVIIGVNDCRDKNLPLLRYAEKDCIDLCDILTSDSCGVFRRENVTLLTGKEATTATVKRVLRKKVVSERASNDLILVYFAGHGFVHDFEGRRRTYLGTYDADISTIWKYPHEGLEMNFLHDEIFTVTKAKALLLVLDCCHSGAIVPEALRDSSARKAGVNPLRKVSENELDLFTGPFISGSGRVALVACAADAVSREYAEYKNGMFTHFLVEGLGGRAAEPASGDVTLDSLSSFLRLKLPRNQEPVRYGQDVGRLVLAHNRELGVERFPKSHLPPLVEPTPLEHPLERCFLFVERILDQVRQEPTRDLSDRILDSIRVASEADSVFVFGGHGDEVVIHSFSVSNSERRDLRADLSHVISLLAPKVLDEHFTRGISHGLCFVDDKTDQGPTKMIVIPATFEHATDLIVLSGMRNDAAIDDAHGSVIRALFLAGRALQAGQDHLLEATLLDQLKKDYGYLPNVMFDRRAILFRRRLETMTMFFQPIVFLRPGKPSLDSWEALARDPATGRAPEDLFEASEVWGRRFMRELDCHFLWKASDISRSKYVNGGPGIDHEISVNVYPQSLMDDNYSKRLGEIIKSGLITPERLTLEISEKAAISNAAIYGDADQELHVFRERLAQYVHDYNVTFAIDDFGARHASVARLARLNPAYVKIDREVLLNDFASLIIKFVLALTKKGRLRPVKCVVEGFDVDSQISLSALYQLGVRYVQGFRLEEPGPEPRYLTQDKILFIANLLESSAPASLDDTLG